MKRDGGDAVLAAARTLGVEVVFSSPGSEWAPVWESLAKQERDATPGPAYLDLLHETLAVAMATGYTIMKRKPQLVLLHAGPGLLQGSMAIHGALLTGVPMVVASAESTSYGEGPVDPGSQWYRNLSVVGGPQAVAAPFVKWSNQAAAAATIYPMTVRAGELAQRAPAGPVYLNIPVEALLEEWTPPATERIAPPPGGTVADAAQVAHVAGLLADARRPVIITESAGRDPGAFEALVELAGTLAIPVVEPQSAVCANFPADHPMHQGENAQALAAAADLVLLVACRAPWYPPSAKPGDGTVVVIDDVPHRPHIAYQVLTADVYLEGGIAATLRALTAATPVHEALVGPRRAEYIAAHDARLAVRAEAEARAAARDDAIDPVAVVAALRDLLDERAVVVDETITHSRTVRGHLDAVTPDRYTYVQGGLGQGLGVALGVKLAERDREVALVVGDGSLLYNPIVQALAASVELDLPLLVVVFNNRQYRSMKLNHLRFYPQGAAVTSGHFRGVDLSGQPDLAGLVQPFDLLGLTVTEPQDLRSALAKALGAVREGRTALVDVRVER